MALSLTIYLTDEFNMSDQEAGWVYGLFGISISIIGLLFGIIIDKLGVRHSLWIGAAIKCVMFSPPLSLPTQFHLAHAASRLFVNSLASTITTLSS